MSVERDELGIILKIISLIWPIGLMYFLGQREKKPKASKQALNMALIGFGISWVLLILRSILLS